MTFNEAVREGCRLLPNQEFRKFFSIDNKGACVIGSAFEAIMKSHGGQTCCKYENYASFSISEKSFLTLIYHFPELELKSKCPIRKCQSLESTRTENMNIFYVCHHLNDYHRWSREAIAEWVDPHPELHISNSEILKQEEMEEIVK